LVNADDETLPPLRQERTNKIGRSALDVLLTRMKTYLAIIAVTLLAPASAAQPAIPELSTPEISSRDQIKASRAREAEETKTGPSARPWDRDSDGKRPWETLAKPSSSTKP
jgi:hypothetical protein